MKKLSALMIITAFLFVKNDAAAQTPKFAYFDLDVTVSLMPGITKIDTLMAAFERDSLDAEYQQRMAEFQRDEQALHTDSGRIAANIYEQRKAVVTQEYYILQNWQQYTTQVINQKQQQLMQPFFSRAMKAYQEVVAAGNYTYVFKKDMLWQAPPADNLVVPVLKKLGIKVPQEMLLDSPTNGAVKPGGRGF